MLEGSDRSLWIATADGLTRLQHNRFTSYSKAQGLPSSDVLSLALDRDQALLATTTEGSVRFENGRFVRTTPAAPRLPPEVKQTDVQTTLVEHLHRVWIGTNNGLLLLQDRRTRKIDLGGSLRPRRINALTEDRQGTLWIGTDHGVAKIIAGKVSWLNSPEAIAQDAILSFLEDRDGDIWIGTDPTGVTVLRDPLFTSFGRDDGLPDDLIRCVPANSGGTLRVGTKDGHFDLRGMRERAEVIDAKLHVATAARHGTCIRLEVPLP